MTIQEAYEKYEHLDDLLSDSVLMESEDFRMSIFYDLWQAIKAEVKERKAAGAIAEGRQL